NAIRPMMETIEVFGCGPGLIEIGEGANMTCLNPNDLFGGGGGGGGPTVPLGDGPRGGGGSGPRPPQRPPRPPKPPLPRTKKECQDKCKAIKTDLDWSLACDAFCNCRFESHNPATVCGRNFKEDTGADAPFR